MPKDATKKPRRKKDAPRDEDRQAVGTAVTERMHQPGQGRAHENVVAESPLEKNLAQLVRGLADIDTLRGDVSELKDVVHRIDGKVDVVIVGRHTSSGDIR